MRNALSRLICRPIPDDRLKKPSFFERIALHAALRAPAFFSVVSAGFPHMRSKLYGYMDASIAGAALSGSFFVELFYDLGVPLRAAMGLSRLGGREVRVPGPL